MKNARHQQYIKALRLLGHKFSPKDHKMGQNEKYNWCDASLQYRYEYYN